MEPKLDLSACQSCIGTDIVWSDEVRDKRGLQSCSQSVQLIHMALRTYEVNNDGVSPLSGT